MKRLFKDLSHTFWLLAFYNLIYEVSPSLFDVLCPLLHFHPTRYVFPGDLLGARCSAVYYIMINKTGIISSSQSLQHVLLSRIGFGRKLVSAVSPWVTVSASAAPFLRFSFHYEIKDFSSWW